MKIIKLPLLVCAIAVGFASCKKDDPIEPTPTNPGYTVPTTYNFTKVNYSGQTTRLIMLDSLTVYMKKGNTSGTVLDAQKMKDMYGNDNSPFGDAALNASGKELNNKTYSFDVPLFLGYFDSLANASQSILPGANGIAGVVVSSSDPTKKYLFDKKGIEYTQIIEKGLMGAVFYYQATSFYLENISTVSNTDTSSQGTTMEHNWDESFGYFGVPTDFPTNTTGIKYWGKYSNSRNPLLGTNIAIMNAFLKGRAAISNKDYTSRDDAKTIVKAEWEKVCASTAISYINSAKTNITDDALRNHALSECIGFVRSLKYNISKKITDAQIQEVLNHIGDNLYEVTAADLDNAKNLLSTVYGLDAVKNSL